MLAHRTLGGPQQTLVVRKPAVQNPPAIAIAITMYYFFSPYYEVALVLALVLLVLVAPSQFTARNTGTILYIGWVFLGNLITLINKLVWNDHARNVAPVWCDISQCSSRLLLCLLVCSLFLADKRSPRHPAYRTPPRPF